MREAPTRAIGRGGKLTAGRGEKLTAGVQVANDLDLPLRQTMLVFKNHLAAAPRGVAASQVCVCAPRSHASRREIIPCLCKTLTVRRFTVQR